MKLIFDQIHGYIELSDKLVRIIDTPEFQRMRDIKQLGTCYYVWPGASHNRFEHSIGVCHLAGKMIRQIKQNNPELNITQDTIEAIEIAGLCHDLGHGPFSHIFDNEFLVKRGINTKLRHHEERSCQIVDYINKKYSFGLNTEFIKKLIYPPPDTAGFIYQIVANPKNGLDVDKFDYIVRDTHNIGLNYSINYARILKQARVIDDNICYPDKEIYNIHELYQARLRLHREIYNHPVAKAIEYMIIDILLDIDSYFGISESVVNPEKFCSITDNILYRLEYTNDNRLLKAQNILLKIKTRSLYKMVDNCSEDLNVKNNTQCITQIMKIGYESSPINNMLFYNCKEPHKAFHVNKSKMNSIFSNNGVETTVRIFNRNLEIP